MVSVGSKINASDYNALKATLDSVYVTKYGQTSRTTAVSGFDTVGLSADTVTSTDMLNLFLDAQSCYVHQTGSVSTTIAVPQTGYAVAADTSYELVGGVNTPVTDGSKMGYNDFLSIITDISNFNDAVSGFPVGNITPATSLSSSRSTSWGGAGQVQAIYHVFTVTFSSVAVMDDFFQAGGQIRFTAGLTGGSGSKDTDWAALLAAMGTVYFGKYVITASSGTPTPTGSGGSGYDSLTGSYRELFVKTGSGVYSDNEYTIEGYKSGAVLRFRVTFNDGDVGTPGGVPPHFVDDPIDESVGGTTTSNIVVAKPESTFVYATVTYNAVVFANPTATNAVLLTTNNVSPPA